MDLVDIVGNVIVICIGLASALYFVRHHKPLVALGCGCSLAVGGFILFAFSYGVISETIFGIMIGTLAIISIASFYCGITNRSREARLLMLWFVIAVAGLPLLQIVLHFTMIVFVASWLGLITILILFEIRQRRSPGHGALP